MSRPMGTSGRQAKRFLNWRQAAYLCTHLRIQYWLEPRLLSRWIRPQILQGEPSPDERAGAVRAVALTCGGPTAQASALDRRTVPVIAADPKQSQAGSVHRLDLLTMGSAHKDLAVFGRSSIGDDLDGMAVQLRPQAE